MKKISSFECKQIKKPVKSAPTSRSRQTTHEKRIKTSKTELQILTLKYFHHVYESNGSNTSLIPQICKYTGFSRRQVYKWFWDENSRKHHRDSKENWELGERIRKTYSEVMELLCQNVFDADGLILKAIYVPSNNLLNKHNNRAVWNIKLQGLVAETIFMKSE